MAKHALKKSTENNKRIIADIHRQNLVCIFAYVLVRLLQSWRFEWTLGNTLLIVVQTVHVIIMRWLSSYAADNHDLAQPGLASYLFDLIYIGWFAQMASCYSIYFYLVYTAVPLYGIYRLVTLAMWMWSSTNP